MFSGPIRGGTRGGQGDFKWTDVADDKDRENYLGHSILAPVGRWQKNRDITWYNNQSKGIIRTEEDQLEEKRRMKEEEIKAIKLAEEEALSLALGFKPTHPRSQIASSSNKTELGNQTQPTKDHEEKSKSKETRAREKSEKLARRLARAEKRLAKQERQSTRESHRHSRSPVRYSHREDYHPRRGLGRREGSRSLERESWNRSDKGKRREEDRSRSRSRSKSPISSRHKYRHRSPSPDPHPRTRRHRSRSIEDERKLTDPRDRTRR